MLRYFCLVAMLILAGEFAGAINLLSGPETVVYDSLNNQYLVSNMYSPYYVVAIDEDGRQSIFKSGLNFPHGMTIANDILYVTTNYNYKGGIFGYDLATGEMVFSKFLNSWFNSANGLTADTSGNLYISIFTSEVYRIELLTGLEYKVVNSMTIPNGLHFDALNNRILIPGEAWDTHLYVVDASTYVFSSIPVELGMYSCITEDQYHNIYVSAFFQNMIYRFNSDFSAPRELVSSGHSGPEGICFNK
ncbi:MAG: hypothetical protein AB1746_04915, partial [Candidatus Zixiibacteriota bacterium]